LNVGGAFLDFTAKSWPANTTAPSVYLNGMMMKKLLVTYRVKDVEWWISNNTLTQVWGPLGVKFQIFRQKDTNLVGYLAEIADQSLLDEVLVNSTLLSTSLKVNGVITETMEMLEEV